MKNIIRYSKELLALLLTLFASAAQNTQSRFDAIETLSTNRRWKETNTNIG